MYRAFKKCSILLAALGLLGLGNSCVLRAQSWDLSFSIPSNSLSISAELDDLHNIRNILINNKYGSVSVARSQLAEVVIISAITQSKKIERVHVSHDGKNLKVNVETPHIFDARDYLTPGKDELTIADVKSIAHLRDDIKIIDDSTFEIAGLFQGTSITRGMVLGKDRSVKIDLVIELPGSFKGHITINNKPWDENYGDNLCQKNF